MHKSISIINVFAIVILSILMAFLSGGIILGIGLLNPDASQKFYTFTSFIIGQAAMLLPLLIFIKSKNISIRAIQTSHGNRIPLLTISR